MRTQGVFHIFKSCIVALKQMLPLDLIPMFNLIHAKPFTCNPLHTPCKKNQAKGKGSLR